MSSASQCPCVGGKGCHLYFTAGETEVWGSQKICLGTYSVSISPWPGMTSLLGVLTCSDWFCSCLPPYYTLTTVLPASQSGGFASCDNRNNILSPFLCYPTPNQSLEDLFIELHDFLFCWKRTCNCSCQRETTLDPHQSIITALCYLRISHCFPYTAFFLLFSAC